MKLLCKLFGHTPPRYHGEIHYGRVIRGGVDGLGTEHASVTAECERCGERYLVIKIHLPSPGVQVPVKIEAHEAAAKWGAAADKLPPPTPAARRVSDGFNFIATEGVCGLTGSPIIYWQLASKTWEPLQISFGDFPNSCTPN